MKKKLIASKVQSELSIERTILANRRTLLAYLRSAVGLVLSGAGLMKFIQDPIWVGIGIVCVILAPIVMGLGIVDYIKVKKLIEEESALIRMQYEKNADKSVESDEVSEKIMESEDI